VQSVGADDQVEVADHAAVERHAYAIALVVERANAVSKHCLDPTAECAEDNRRELAARDAHVPPVGPAHEQLRIERRDALSVGVDLPDLAQVISAAQYLGHDAHAVGHIEAGTPEVDEIAALAKCRSVLDERRLVAGVLQPVSERRTGDARADDEGFQHRNLHCQTTG
jgi:hypothetical protein